MMHMFGKIIFNLRCYLPAPLIDIINRYWIHYLVYQNINSDPKDPNQKRVLISYTTSPLERDTEQIITHTNYIVSLEIIKSFIEFGYSIDLLHCLDERHNSVIKRKRYDVVFGFGEPFYRAALQNPQAIKIVFLTESCPDFSFMHEQERIDYYYQRHNKKVPIKRSGKYLKKRDVIIADYGILHGNYFTLSTYSKLQDKIYLHGNIGLINPNFVFIKRNFLKTRNNFVWFGSDGAIHKGLDILIDVFNQLPNYNLYICGLNPLEKRLFKIKTQNIHDMGFIDVKSDSFIQLVNSCSYVILPSCSEGIASSILTCMNHGLIPIVTRQCGIDIQEWGFYLEDYHIEYVKDRIKTCTNLEPEILEIYHKKVFEYSRKNFNINKYSYSLRKILKKLVTVQGDV